MDIFTITDIKFLKQNPNNRSSLINRDQREKDRCDHIDIIFDNGAIISIKTEGDCCSESWFEPLDLDEFNNFNKNKQVNEIIGPFEQLIGRTMNYNIKNVQFTQEKIKYSDSVYREKNIITKCTILLSDGIFSFLDQNISNGYYCSMFSISYSTDNLSLKNCKESNLTKNSKATLVVGLPYSGKSTYCQNNYPEDDIYDDFLFCYCKRDFLINIGLGKHIIINDPRLCKDENLYIIIKFLKQILRKEQIEIIYFKNDPIICLSNCDKLGGYDKIDDINRLSKDYDRTFGSKILKIDFEIVDVYTI